MARKKAPYIVVAGNIGCGKSTLVQVLCEHYGVEPVYEDTYYGLAGGYRWQWPQH